MTETGHTGTAIGTRTFGDDDQVDEPDDQQPAWDALDALTLAELDAGSRLLKASLVKAMAETTENYERAVGILAYLHARRADRETKPDELLRRFTSMRYSEVTQYLADLAPAKAGDLDTDPTDPGRE